MNEKLESSNSKGNSSLGTKEIKDESKILALRLTVCRSLIANTQEKLTNKTIFTT